MAAGVVDDLELIEIEIQQRVMRVPTHRFDSFIHAALELVAIGQTGERIVIGQMRNGLERAPVFGSDHPLAPLALDRRHQAREFSFMM